MFDCPKDSVETLQGLEENNISCQHILPKIKQERKIM